MPHADRIVELLADLDRPGAWMLLVDGIAQSHVDLDDPRHLELEYVRRLGHVIDLASPAGHPLRVLHLGGGGLTLARYVAATRPGSRQLAIESDAEVADLVSRRLPLDTADAGQAGEGRIDVLRADARAALADLPPGGYDLVIADIFAGAQTPAHVTSAQFIAAAASMLAPGGIYTANIGDGPPLDHARGRVAAVRSVLGEVCLIAEAGVLHGRRFGNLVVAASDAGLPVSDLTRLAAADPFPAQVIDGAELEAFVRGAQPITDASALPSPSPPPAAFA